MLKYANEIVQYLLYYHSENKQIKSKLKFTTFY